MQEPAASGAMPMLTAMITGGTTGIGFSIARAFAQSGYRVVLTYARDAQTAENAARALRDQGHDVLALRGDQTVRTDVDTMFAETISAFGSVEVLVNNAGVASFGPLADATQAEYERLFGVNVLGPLLMTQAFLRTAKRGASIVNISTVGTGPAAPGTGLYTASKAALTMMTRVFANELAPRGIRVNAIAPGTIETDRFRERGHGETDRTRRIIADTPLGRLGRPEDISPLAVFLASESAGWITGEVITAAGGRH